MDVWQVMIPFLTFVMVIHCNEVTGDERSANKEGNLLLEKLTMQSSLIDSKGGVDATSDKAVDGNTNGNFNAGSCMRTKKESAPWWKVDMGVSKCVGKVTIYNRVDKQRSRLVGAIVRLGSDDDIKNNAECGTVTRDQFRADNKKVDVTCNLEGRFLSIELTTKNALHMCEVQAFECEDTARCETGWVEYLDSCYFFAHEAKVTYSEAQNGCSDKNAQLVTINNQDEQQFLAARLENGNPDYHMFGYYIGMDDIESEGTFTWSDGTPVTFTAWAPGQPDNKDGIEDCVGMVFNQDGKWNDYICESRFLSYICEKKEE